MNFAGHRRRQPPKVAAYFIPSSTQHPAFIRQPHGGKKANSHKKIISVSTPSPPPYEREKRLISSYRYWPWVYINRHGDDISRLIPRMIPRSVRVSRRRWIARPEESLAQCARLQQQQRRRSLMSLFGRVIAPDCRSLSARRASRACKLRDVFSFAISGI